MTLPTYWTKNDAGDVVKEPLDASGYARRRCDICDATTIDVVARIKGKTICWTCSKKAAKQVDRKRTDRFWWAMAQRHRAEAASRGSA